MEQILAQLQADPATNTAILAVVSLAVLDFITGTVRALVDRTFSLNYLDGWVRKHLLAVVTITLVLGFGRFVGHIVIGPTDLSVLTGAGLVAAASFAATALKSVLDNLSFSVQDTPPTA